MKKNWQACKNILIIRLDNMGDLLMSTPAIRAIKRSINCTITLLASSAGAAIAPYIKEIDDVMVADVPWVKTDKYSSVSQWHEIVSALERRKFDGAIIFTVFSQNPMPAILLAWLAGIPNRLAYCRENPYHLLTDWVPEQEPYNVVRHQVERDLFLVSNVGAVTIDHSLSLQVPSHAYSRVSQKLAAEKIDCNRPWIIVHPRASECKREYPLHLFKLIIQELIDDVELQVVITGTDAEMQTTSQLCNDVGRDHCRSLAGKFSLEEFMALIDIAPLVLSVNTGTVHIASALHTPVVVLYARTNPQHTPWQVRQEVCMFPVAEEMRSKNEILRYVQDHIMASCEMPGPEEIITATKRVLKTVAPRSV